MKVKDMFTQEFEDEWGDVDVYDNVCEDLAVAFCGARLTKAGRSHFRSVLDLPVEVFKDSKGYATAIVTVDEEDDGWERRMRKAAELFNSAAGYCSIKDYNKWFKEES